jgi:N-sulfoglucosamine sulfohydrolase
MAFPFAKANCYLHSTRTPLMIRWPGVSQPGMDEMHMVNGIDLLPTLFEGLGIPLPPDVPRGAMLEPLNEARELWRPIPPQIDGRSCFELLAGGTSASHEHLHTEFHRTHGNSNFEMRCVQTREWGYIYNAWAQQNKWYRNESCSGRTFNAMKAAAESDPAIAERVTMFVHRVPEELYNFKADPDALRNCVDDPEAQSVLMDMRSRMRNWMQDTGDTLVHMYDRHLDAANGHTALRK